MDLSIEIRSFLTVQNSFKERQLVVISLKSTKVPIMIVQQQSEKYAQWRNEVG